MPGLSDEGRAKVNLTLRVNGRRADGYHDLESVVAFADCADRVTLTPGPDLDLKMSGPLAQACGETSDNLVLKAARLLAERVPNMKAGSFSLDKVLPVAAGIGGGSADAAAALRLLAQLNGLALDDPRILKVAQLTGADVPVCVRSLACVMTGVGETLQPLNLPKIPCVMVNPCVPSQPATSSRRSACAMVNCWSAPPIYCCRTGRGPRKGHLWKIGLNCWLPVPMTWKRRRCASSRRLVKSSRR